MGRDIKLTILKSPNKYKLTLTEGQYQLLDEAGKPSTTPIEMIFKIGLDMFKKEMNKRKTTKDIKAIEIQLKQEAHKHQDGDTE